MNQIRIILASALAIAATNTSAIDVNTTGISQWVCGGAGEQERIQLKGLESEATTELMFVSGKRGGYLADVDFVVRDQRGGTVLQGRADGPKCLLTVPVGRYKVDATHAGAKRSANFHVTRAPGNPARTVLTFPADPSDTIASSAQEKAGVKVK